jgi:hypothetical protein
VRKNRWTGRIIKHPKKRGEWVELVFAIRAIELELWVGRPWGDSLAYDFTVDMGSRIVRVQVKCTIFRLKTRPGGYVCGLKSSGKPYKKNSFDFVAAYVIPEDVWYIIPEKKVRGMYSVVLYPKLESSKYNQYKEAWHLLSGEKPGVVPRIEACADEYFAEKSPLLAKNARNGARVAKLLLWLAGGRSGRRANG